MAKDEGLQGFLGLAPSIACPGLVRWADYDGPMAILRAGHVSASGRHFAHL